MHRLANRLIIFFLIFPQGCISVQDNVRSSVYKSIIPVTLDAAEYGNVHLCLDVPQSETVLKSEKEKKICMMVLSLNK